MPHVFSSSWPPITTASRFATQTRDILRDDADYEQYIDKIRQQVGRVIDPTNPLGYTNRMPEYRRAYKPGGTFFFTVVTHRRRPLFRDPKARRILHDALNEARARRPFTLDAIVLLPDHLHVIWTQPEDDHDFSTRWRKIKEAFTRQYRAVGGIEGGVTEGQERKSLAGYWQQRFWEHTIRDETDYQRHVDYIHYNPVKHGLVTCPHAWEWSSFGRWVKAGIYAANWCCACRDQHLATPNFEDILGAAGE